MTSEIPEEEVPKQAGFIMTAPPNKNTPKSNKITWTKEGQVECNQPRKVIDGRNMKIRKLEPHEIPKNPSKPQIVEKEQRMVNPPIPKNFKQSHAFMFHICDKCGRKEVMKLNWLFVADMLAQLQKGYNPKLPDGITVRTYNPRKNEVKPNAKIRNVRKR